MSAMDAYVLKTPCRVSDVLLGERYEVEFDAGTVTPKNEAEEHALSKLAAEQPDACERAPRKAKAKED